MEEKDRYQQMLILCKLSDTAKDKAAKKLLRSINVCHIPNRIIREVLKTIDVWPTKEDGQRLKQAYIQYDRERQRRRKEREGKSNNSKEVEVDSLASITDSHSTVFIIQGDPCLLLGFAVVNNITNARFMVIGSGREFCVDSIVLHDAKPMRLSDFLISKK